MIKQFPIAVVLAFFSIIVSGCSSSASKEDAAPLTIGSLGPGGGVIFAFLDETYNVGLEVFPSSIGQSAWGCDGTFVDEDETRASNGVGAPSGAISSGILREVNSMGICYADAAEMAFAFNNNDLNDWYLPSTDELITIRDLGLMPGAPGDSFWSSTEDSDLNAFVVLIRSPDNPIDNGDPSTSEKGHVANVLPIRTFLIN